MQNKIIKTLKNQLLYLLKKDALKKGKFILSSGKTSKYYLDGRVVTLTPEGAYLTAAIILEMIGNKRVDAVGGPTLGADPIVGAIAVLSYLKNIPLKTFIVRKAVKQHGTQRLIEGPELSKKDRVVLVDDVATTGGSLIEAYNILKEKKVKVTEAIVIVDRKEGARETLAKQNIILRSIFTLRELGL